MMHFFAFWCMDLTKRKARMMYDLDVGEKWSYSVAGVIFNLYEFAGDGSVDCFS